MEGSVSAGHRPRLCGQTRISFRNLPRTLRTLVRFWWSQLLFPGTGDDAEADVAPDGNLQSSIFNLQSARTQAVVLVIMAALLFFCHLGCPLQEPEESRYAEIPRQMLQTGNFAVPLLDGNPYYDKPPLLYWMVMASYSVFGVHDWSARLISSGAAFFTVLLTYFWGKRVVGSHAAFAGAAILCLSGRFVFLGRLLTMNSLLCLWVVAGLAGAHLAVRGPSLRWRWWLVSAAACGLGLLTKGPVAIVLIMVPVVVYQALDARAARLGIRSWLVYLVTAATVACPWYASAAARDPEFLSYFFWKHNLVRYVAPFDHAKPAWYYLGDLLLGMLPWSLLLPGLFQFIGRRSSTVAARRPSALGFLMLAALWCLAFYSLAGSKRAGYILPAMPPLALALGWYLQTRIALWRQRASSPLAPVPGGEGLGFAFQATMLVLSAALLGSIWALAIGILRPGTTLFLVGGTSAALVMTCRYGRRLSMDRSWLLCGSLTFLTLLMGLHSALPAYAARYSMRSQVRKLAELSRDGDVPVVCYPRRWDSVSFYLGRCDARIYEAHQRLALVEDLRAHPETVAVIKSERYLQEFIDNLPTSLEFVPCSRPANVVVGRVRPRPEVPANTFARR
jgi:4-amino-4-deoxy-L-arabinose transferase-like glycosyltransferase